MKKKAIVVIVLIILLTFLVGSAITDIYRLGEPPECLIWCAMPENTNLNLKYFGFYNCDYREDSLQEVMDLSCTNVIFIYTRSYAMRDSLQACKERNMKAMIRWENGIKGASVYCHDLIVEYNDTILGFYFDEPWWHNYSLEYYHFVTKTLRETYPDKEVFSCLAVCEFANMPQFARDMTAQGVFARSKAPEGYYKYCTILGFDFYCAWNPYKVLYLQFFKQLKALCTPEQKIWLVPKGFYAEKGYARIVENHIEPIGNELINSLKEHYKLALREPKVEGIIVFAYMDGTFSEWGIAIENFVNEYSPHYREDVKKYYQQIGREIIKNANYQIVRT